MSGVVYFPPKAWPKFFPPTCQWEEQRNIAIQLLFDLYAEMEHDKWSGESSKSFVIAQYHRFYHMYLEIHRYMRENVDRFGNYYKITPKFHLVIHILEDSEGNPRDEWCYIDESEIGTCADLAAKLHVKSLSRVLIERYRIG